VAVASAGPYASVHLAPDKYHSSTPPLSFFTGRMPFLPPNQQCQSTEGILMSRTVSIIMYLAIQTIRVLHNISVASVLYYVPPHRGGIKRCHDPCVYLSVRLSVQTVDPSAYGRRSAAIRGGHIVLLRDNLFWVCVLGP